MDKYFIVEALINLEICVAGLYRQFSGLFEEDQAFWQRLAAEEEAHAQILRNNRTIILEHLRLPASRLKGLVSSFELIAKRIVELSQEYQKEKPDKSEAYVAAIQLEQSAGEIHFQEITSCLKDTQVKCMFEKFNQADQDHTRRIRNRLKKPSSCPRNHKSEKL